MAGYKRGSSGQPVVEIQQRLIAHGFSVGPHGIDGKFGPDTAAGVTSFQAARGLKVDGIVGPDTLNALRAPPPGPVTDVTSARTGSGIPWFLVGLGLVGYVLWKRK